MKDKKNNIYLIDGHALCYRAYYAIQELTTSTGMPTNAVYGFINMLRKLLKNYDPKMFAIVFDSKGPTVRHKKYSEYKIHRKPMPEDLVGQISKIKEVISAFGIETFQMDGFEADDIIATLAEETKRRNFDVTIVTSDKDAMQLVDEHVKVLSPHMGQDKIYGECEVKEKYGVAPECMIDLMALMGDASDNIPGVKGIGLVTAGKLISQYGTIENVYNNIEEISSESVKKKLKEGKDMAEFSREMVTLDRALPVKIDMDKLCLGSPDTEKLMELYRELEFDKLLKEIMPQKTNTAEYLIKYDASEIKEIAAKIKKLKLTAFRVAEDSHKKTIRAFSFCFAEGEAYCVPFAGGTSRHEEVYKLFKDILEDEKIKKISFNAKEDIFLLRRSGIDVKGIVFDVMIADYLIDPARSKYDLPDMVVRCLGYKLQSKEEGTKLDKRGQAVMELSSDKEEFDKYSEESDVIFRLYSMQKNILKEKGLDLLFNEVEMPLIEVLLDMETEGVDVDVECLKKQSRVLAKKLESATEKIYSIAGEKFNINSPKQLQHILYEKLRLTPLKKTKTGFSTDESVLKRLAEEHELPKILLEYRQLNKLKTGYYDSLIDLESDSKIYARFNQAVTATGRLSSSEPNLQNIPIKTELGKEIRRAFIAGSSECVLLSADYSQIELRILAHLSQDKNLMGAFKNEEDVHRFTASLIFDCDPEKVTGKMRRIAKMVNFGIAYGMSPFGLAKDLNIGYDEAQKFIEAYFERYPGIKTFIEETVSKAGEDGFVTTILNRRRYVSNLNTRDKKLRGFAERVAVNTPVQGSAADIIKLAMIKCHNEFKNTGVRMIIQVHDELVFKIPKNLLESAAKKIKEIMENVTALKVPLKVDIETGKNWLDMEPVRV